ncbi:putative RNA methylase [Methanocaldococcus infernus ME]|uniref:RNA methylase n=1 Tax=Methanocaldococcus infernus (strain DSM 11812 / JCM 15783 / ME) TaxID=573063 RepID=D5VSX1_METIM|nr:tRNA (guanine(6)-N2)-methyltransferase [Methanocaldococcus infernus]ADG13674.1 putative RNA methylase [Methanocaldococcus infernus ME]
MELYSTLSPGLEKIAKEEIESLGGKVKEIREERGRVFFEGDLKVMAKLNYFSRTLERINILLYRGEVESLEDIYEVIYNLDWTFIDENKSFAIRPLRVGSHNFTSIDIGRVAGEALIKSYLRDKNVRLKVNLDEPDVIVRVELIHNELLVGLDTTGDIALDKRGYRVYNHLAHLNSTIAASLIYLGNFREYESLLDPMCGSATILIEGALIRRNIPPGIFRERKYGFSFLNLFGRELLEDVKREVNINYEKYLIYGIDKNPKFLEGAKRNLESAMVDDTVNLILGDATKIDKIFNEVDLVVVNPPYGIRLGKKRLLRELYNNFLLSVKRVMHGNSRVICITAETKLFEEAIAKADLTVKEKFNVKFGGLSTKVYYLTL